MIFFDFISFTPLLLLLNCLFLITFKRWIGPIGTFYFSILSIFITLLITLFDLYKITLIGFYSYVDFGRWFYCLDLIDSHLVFCIDPLSTISSALVLFLTMFALYFGVEYMYREAFINRLLYLLNLFATSVIFLFYSYDYFLILLSWECIGLFSFLLVNFYSSRIYTIKAAIKTFVLSRISDMFMFLSFILTVNTFNSTELSFIFIQAPFLAFHYIFMGDTAIHFLTLFSFCLSTSGAIKAAQFFFHVWLPDAMEAPTPASALIHSSTLVVAGVFLVIRFSIIFEFTVFTNYYLALMGGMTLAFGSITASFQNDIKKLVAYSTISQIGYLVCGCGFCCYEEVLIYLIVHALNKAFLFIIVGYTVHFFSGNTDMRQMGGSYIYSFDLCVLLFGVSFNLTGLPYSAGFLGKEFLLFQVMREDFLSLFVRSCWLVSFFFTPIYMFTLVYLVLFGVKKSTASVYSSSWTYNYPAQLKSNLKQIKLSTINSSLLTRVQQTSITSRLTTFILLSFWTFFLFFGETLYLLLFNYSVLTDSIMSSSFLTIKQHVPLTISSFSFKLSEYITMYIYLFAILAVNYLNNYNYTSAYNYAYKSRSNVFLPLVLFLVFLVS